MICDKISSNIKNDTIQVLKKISGHSHPPYQILAARI